MNERVSVYSIKYVLKSRRYYETTDLLLLCAVRTFWNFGPHEVQGQIKILCESLKCVREIVGTAHGKGLENPLHLKFCEFLRSTLEKVTLKQALKRYHT